MLKMITRPAEDTGLQSSFHVQ